jgi:hypothetical protein
MTISGRRITSKRAASALAATGADLVLGTAEHFV